MSVQKLVCSLVFMLSSAATAMAQDTTVPFYHNTLDHAGRFTVPGLTAAGVAATAPDTGFNGAVFGLVNAAPLYWHPAGATLGTVIVATESNQVSALAETTGQPIWTTQLAAAAPRSGACSAINPVGVTGTPVIDTTTGTLYLDAVVQATGGEQHMVYALSLATGAVLPGWPITVAAGLQALGIGFDDTIEEQRGALSLVNGEVYIPFGGYDGDCDDYHGMVVSVSTAARRVTGAFSTRAHKGGIWAPGGVVSDGHSLFVTTGNTAATTSWAGGEAVVHLPLNLKVANNPHDYFSPSNWQALDAADQDLGGVSPTLIDLPGATPTHLLLALGKDDNAYLLNRGALGGIGTALQTLGVSTHPMRSATARYTVSGDPMVVINAQSRACPGAQGGVLALRVAAAPAPRVSEAWCAAMDGAGAPIVTTSNGTANPIVWITGAEGDEKLHAYDGQTGQLLYSSSALTATIPHFSTLLVANHRLFVPATNQVFAFTLAP